MLFASSFGDGFLGLMLFLSIGIWSAQRLMKKFDNDGAVKDAAKKGVVSMIGRWLK